MTFRLFLFLLLLFAVAACDSAEPEERVPTSLTDTWSGTVLAQGTAYTFTVDIIEASTSLSGGGTMATSTSTAPFTLDGGYVHPSLQMRFVFTDRPPISFTGRVNEGRDEITGQLTTSGFGGETITLERQ